MNWTVDRAEARRYWGCRGEGVDAAGAELLERCLAEVEGAVRPRWIWRRFSAEAGADGVRVGGRVFFASRELARHLAGCREVALLAVTLGVEADRLVRMKAAKGSAAEAAAVDAGCSALVEQACDAAEREIAAEWGGALRARFSPGYGDWALEDGGVLLAMLEAGKRIGVGLTEGGMMCPMKSVSAVVGLGGAGAEVPGCPESPEGAGCGDCAKCGKRDCGARKER